MAETKAALKAAYPLPAYNYRVTIEAETIAFSDVSGISLEYEHQTYRHGLSFLEGEKITTHKIDKYVSINFKSGVVKDRTYLYDWLTARELRAVHVSLCDETGTPVVSWKIARAIPVKLDAPGFDTNTNDVAIESLEVMATGISVEHH